MIRATVCALVAIWPIGVLAADTAIGPDTDSARVAGTAGWVSARNGDTGVEEYRQQATRHRIAREESTRWSESIYRYGQREPAPEELPMKGRAPMPVPASGSR